MKEEKLVTSENENMQDNDEQNNSKQTFPNIIENEEDDFYGYSKAEKYKLFILFFFLGIINHLGTILVMTGGRLLAYELEMKDYVTVYTSVSTIFSVLTRIINSKLCLKVSYKTRVVIICFWMMAGYVSMFAVLTLHETILEDYNVLCFILSFIPCFFLGSSYAFGESAMIAYLRLFPKTLIAGWSSGTGLSGLISGGLNFLSQLLNGLPLKFLYLILSPVGLVYLVFFMFTYRIFKRHERRVKLKKQSRFSLGRDSSLRKTNIEELKNKIEEENKEAEEKEKEEDDEEEKEKEKNNEEEKKEKDEEKENEEEENENDEEKGKNENALKEQTKQIYESGNMSIEDEDELDKSFRKKDDEQLENMNKKNKVMNCKNFSKVMNMCGEVIINLGLIYFLQFFCVNALIVRNCDKVDISFLPLGCSENHHSYRKGKFEFINLAYQVGMFLSKTFIKIVRKIQPIEVYTIVIVVMNVIYIAQYYTGIMHWGFYLFIGLILGFFSGGTYAGGFYTILNSNRVKKNYKELTVNVATLFNDSGTFLSGIAGFIALKYIFDNDKAFDGQEVVPRECDPDNFMI